MSAIKDEIIKRLLSLEEAEKEHIKRVIAQTRTLAEAAKVLKINCSTLWRKRKEYGLDELR